MVAKKKYRLRCLKTDFRIEALRRREEVREIVAWMQRTQGPGWRKRMQYLDGYMDEDSPSLWVSGRRVPTLESVQRLREYAERFGYKQVSVPQEPSPSSNNAGVNTDLTTVFEALSELALPTREFSEKKSAAPSPTSAGEGSVSA